MLNSLKVESSLPECEIFVGHYDSQAFEALKKRINEFEPQKPSLCLSDGYFRVVFT